MGYLPKPNTLICSQCGLIEATDNPRQMGRRLSELAEKCPHPKRPDDPSSCSWGQLDVIFAHWSGSWKSASPNMTVYDQSSRRPVRRNAVCGKCGSRQFILNKDQVALSNWNFSCANCLTRHPDPWVDKCDETLARIASTIGPGGNVPGEAAMEKINYAASAAYFVRSDTFITFPEGSGIEALEPGQQFLLPGVIEKIIGLEGPPLTSEEVVGQLLEKGRTAEKDEFDQILSGLKLAEDNKNAQVAAFMEKMKAEKLANWLQAGWLTRSAALPAAILGKLQNRHEWSGKFDPFRLLVEHSALTKTKLRGEIVGGRASYVDFTSPDEWLVEPNSPLDEFQGNNFAASMLGSVDVMSGYLEEHDRKSNPTIYLMTYALLHSYAHYVMQGIQQFSGLDLGSMGEYLFPCDLAFVVYRNGMTLDLGDLSALWRNHHEAFLSYLRNYPSSLGCNLGNLCMQRGGACPDCIMIPEVICLTANKYLSRSTLIGRGRPDFIVGEQRIDGFLQMALEHARAQRPAQ